MLGSFYSALSRNLEEDQRSWFLVLNMNKNLNHFRTIHWNIEIIGTIRKRSDETIDIELDQKYAMTREREKKLKIPEKERKNTDPSLNTQFCTKGFLVVQEFWFWPVWAAWPVLKKINDELWATFEGSFSFFHGRNIFYIVGSAVKSCLYIFIVLHFFHFFVVKIG